MGAELRERNRLVLAAAAHARFEWAPLVIEEGGHRVELQVLADAMMVGEPGDWIRPTCTHPTAQRIADLVGALLPTEKIADEAWKAAVVKITPQTMTPDSRMASTTRMIVNSQMVDRALAKEGFEPGGYQNGEKRGICGGVSKIWAIGNRLDNPLESMNGAWHSTTKTPYRTPGGLYVWQPLGTAHVSFPPATEADHDDYSQKVAYLVLNQCKVDEEWWALTDLLQHPELARLVSYEGPLKSVRHPAVPFKSGADEGVQLKRGSKGIAVHAWQVWLLSQGYDLGPSGADGSFGPRTESATMQAQQKAGIAATGIADAYTLALMGKLPADLQNPGTSGGPYAYDLERFPQTMRFVNSRVTAQHYRKVSRSAPRHISRIVIHTMEWAERTTTAEACAAYFKAPGMRNGKPIQASAHLCIDSDSVVQCVPFQDVAFAAPGANADGLQIELAGFARQTAEEWADAFSSAQLEKLAQIIAALVQDLGIEVVELNAGALKDPARSGITTHAAASKAFKLSDHTDPGPNFPMAALLDRVMELLPR